MMEETTKDLEGVVFSHEEVADGFRFLQIRIDGHLPCARPGQFVQIRPSRTTTTPFLRMPLSVSHVDRVGSTFGVLYDVVGPKTRALSDMNEGDRIDCLGPLGNPFPDVPDDARPVLVGGGIGVPPLLHLGTHLRSTGMDPILIVGARTAGKHLPLELLSPASEHVRLATDDGSLGHHGFVTDLLAQALKEEDKPVVYTCGPHPMMAAGAAATESADVRCYSSLEEYMACGFGVCVGCVVERRTQANSPYDQFTRVCVDGPVYDATEIVW